MLHYMEIADMNLAARSPEVFIRHCEGHYAHVLENAARKILAGSADKPIVLLSGPSGSGKTTTAVRIARLLQSWGHGTHALSMDNYYFRDPAVPMPIDDEGNPDYESPVIVDSALVQQHLAALSRGDAIAVPRFDFVAQRRAEETAPMRRLPGEIVVVEGIHALNPAVVGDVHNLATTLYVSVRTRVKDANGFVLHPSKVRLMRRLMRDRRGRGQSFEETVARVRSVNRGERLYIMPYKDNADIAIDSFCPYELPVYRDILLPGLLLMDPEFMEDCDVSDMAPMLRQIAPIGMEGISREALIREFIGGGLVEG
jgi:uridine kinase